MRKTFALAAGALAAATAIGAQSAPNASLPITHIAYRVTFTKQSAAARSVASEMSFDVSSAGTVALSLPAWTPGEYEIYNHARNVSSFSASEGGASIGWEKIDPDTWRVHPARAGRVTVSFEYAADTLDNGSAWIRNKMGEDGDPALAVFQINEDGFDTGSFRLL